MTVPLLRLAASIVAAVFVACAGGATTGGAAPTVDRRVTVVIQAGSGSVTSAPAGISCPQTCSALFPAGTSVTLTATPATDFRFEEWSSASGCTVQPTVPNQCRITVLSDVTVGVVFRPAATLHVFPNGSGSVIVSPPGIDLATGAQLSRCDRGERPEGCRLAYQPGTRVTATATPGAGKSFVGWSASGCGTGPCTVEAEAGENSLVATFNPLQLIVVTSGSGVVTSSPAGIDCGDGHFACAVDAPLGTTFVLDAGTRPHEWRFGCEPDGGDPRAARCTATVSGLPTEAGVSFGGAGGPEPPDRISIRLDVVRTGAAGAVQGRKIDCRQARCSASYKFGDMEELRPVDGRGARFRRWVNGCGTTRVCRFPVGPITSLEAVFGPPLSASIVRLRASGRGAQRAVVARLQVNQPASVSLRLTRNGKRIATANAALAAGQTPVRVKVPRRASAGRYGVVAIVKTGDEQRRLVRAVQVGR